MPHPCVVVLTARGFTRILHEHGTQAWRLKPENARRIEYCVCVQNRKNGDWGNADQKHHHAFMVGRISDVLPSPEKVPHRYLVKFSEFALIDYANAWPGNQNPVRYGTLQEFDVVDPEALAWHAMPTSRSS